MFLLLTMSEKRGEMKQGEGRLLSCVWITANCLDEETLMSLMSHYLFSFHYMFLLSSPWALCLFYLSVLFLSSIFAVPYVCLNYLAFPFLFLVWDQWHLMLSTLPD